MGGRLRLICDRPIQGRSHCFPGGVAVAGGIPVSARGHQPRPLPSERSRLMAPPAPVWLSPVSPLLRGGCTTDTATGGQVAVILVRPAGAQFPILSVFNVAARQEPRQPRPVSRVGKVPLNLIPGVQQDRLGEDPALVGGH